MGNIRQACFGVCRQQLGRPRVLLLLRILYGLLWLGLVVPPLLTAIIVVRGGVYPYLLEIIGIGSSLILVFFYTRTRLPFVFLHKTSRDTVIQFYYLN